MTDIDPTIKEVAAIYGFKIEWNPVLAKWMISDKGYGFYWDSTQNKETFFEELKSFFFDAGAEHANNPYGY